MFFDAVNNMVPGVFAEKYPILRFFPRENRTTEISGIDIADFSRDHNTVINWLLEHSSALKDENVTVDILNSKEE